MLGPFGHLIVFGFVTGMPEGTLEEALLGCLNTTSSITTSDLYTLYIHQPTEFRELLLELAAMLEDGLIQPKIHDAIPVDSVALAHDQLDKGLVQGKLLISF